jgi:hypothetical protein
VVTDEIWVQKDGTEIRLQDMADSHVENTLRLLERVKPKIQDALSDAWAVSCAVSGEMASYYIDRDIDDLEEQVFAADQKISMFKDEIKRRKMCTK